MKLDRVTMTGADDSVSPADLAALSKEFPFVEWGILFSRKQQGSPRWPSTEWLSRMGYVANQEGLDLSAHVCGGWIRDMLIGGSEFFLAVLATLEDYNRTQLNFHAEPLYADPAALASTLARNADLWPLGRRQFIFQMDGRNDSLMQRIREQTDTLDIVPLFDVSHGAGTLPTEWPVAAYRDMGRTYDAPKLYHGYAGGLGPDTIADQLPKIAAAAGDARFWIDMETRIRSNGDRVFDLEKVRAVLEYCAPFVAESATA